MTIPISSNGSENEPSRSAYEKALFEFTVEKNRWLPQRPTTRQAEFLRFFGKEALFGGSAGGGKSSALMMAALQFADVAGYRAIIFRKTFADLSLPGALMDRAREWLGPTPATWDEKRKTWFF